ncbi:protein NDRG3-like [Tachypleus tridentatus]|uniref:protein NDRG3-like n=1 Tax=Tachypleus tridentatus TaxID=6853 RepID=UPI003FD07053
MPTPMMDDIELRNVELQIPIMRSSSKTETYNQEEMIETDFGRMFVAVQGERNKQAIITCHDLGLNNISNFQAFFNYVDMRVLLQSFCVYHLNAPGQEEGAQTLPEGYVYPTMDQLAEMVLCAVKFFNLKHFVGFGVGAGANILARFALQYPDLVDGLFFINCTSTVAGWTEWGYQKLNSMCLRSSGMTSSPLEYLLWHHFGNITEDNNYDLVQAYSQYFTKVVNPYNLSLFIDSYIRRTDLQIQRELDNTKRKSERRFKSGVLLMSGALSPHLDDTIEMNGRLDPSNSTWMKISDCGMVMEEQPGKVAEVLRLFLQGLGFAPTISTRGAILTRKRPLEEENVGVGDQVSNFHQEVHIVENPIDQHTLIC